MKKIISILFLIILLVATPIHSSDVFISSDNMINKDVDIEILNSIKEDIENIDSSINVKIDPNAPGPGEGTRVITSNGDTGISLAAACAGNFLTLAEYSLKSDKQIIYVNTGDYDINSDNSLRRAWDDNYSNDLFAGIKNPGKFLNEAGVSTVQPLQKFPDAGNNGFISGNNEDVNKYIASESVKSINNYDSNKEKHIDSNLINYHKIQPSIMASSSHELVKSESIDSNLKYDSFTPEQLLYLTSTYLGSDGIDNPKNYEKVESPLKYSLFTKNSYSIGEYMEMGEIVKTYMDENGKAPNYIQYKGAIISYYDLVYNFAIITQDHDTASNMGFDSEYEFHKYNESIFINLIPFILVIIVLISIYLLYRKIRH
ncbi:MAG: adhesin [Methanobacteriaceae archaeon]|jgi:hypothetical protein|nr:adhesin [Methanobacteriaceae archaeon]